MSRRHGSYATYRSGGCRCQPCRDAHRQVYLDERLSRRDRLIADPSLAPHGLATTYKNWLCRCPKCSKANTESSREYRRLHGLVSP